MFTCEMDENHACKIQKAMEEAENIMETYLRNKKLYEII